MKPQFSTRWIIACSLIAALAASAGSFSANFNDGQVPAGVTMLDGATVDTSGGPDGSGCMKLTAAAQNLAGGFVLPDLDPGNRIQTFVATFNVHMGNGTTPPADGFAFNFGSAPSTSTFGPSGIVNGAGLNGISVGFDAFDNGTADDQEAPECCVRMYLAGGSPQLIARRKLSNQLKTGSGYVPVMIRMNVAGTLDVYLNNVPLFTNLFLTGTEATGWRFSFTAKTGGSYQEHWIDDLNITTVQQPIYRHYVKSAFPIANNSLANVTNAIVQIPLQNEADTNLTTMLFNGVQVPITWSGVGTGKPIATYDPHGLPPGSVNTATLNIVDSSGPAEVMTWTFSITNAPLWTLAPGSRAYLSAVSEGTTPKCRSLAYNRFSNVVYVVSRETAGNGNIYVLDANTGADLFQLNTAVVTATGNLPLNCVAVGDDGTVYAANEPTANQTGMIYRWRFPDSSTPGEVVYTGVVSGTYRTMDCFDVRGNYTNALFLTDATTGGAASILFTTADGVSWSPSSFTHAYAGTQIGRQIQFGSTNTYFLKKKQASTSTSALPLDLLTAYNTTPGDQSSATVLSSVADYHYQVGAMGIDLSNNIGAGVFFSSVAGDYDRLYLFDLSNLNSPLMIATYNAPLAGNGSAQQCYNFPVAHIANANWIAQVAIGGGKIFAIDANNGIIAVPEFPPVATITPPPPKLTATSTNGSIVIRWPVTGAGEVLQANATLAPGNWSNTGLTPVASNGVNSVTITPGGANYYRLAK
jgi:hypothetical protein